MKREAAYQALDLMRTGLVEIREEIKNLNDEVRGLYDKHEPFKGVKEATTFEHYYSKANVRLMQLQKDEMNLDQAIRCLIELTK